MPRVENVRVTGVFASNDEGKASLVASGDAALVFRGIPRMLLVRCPCGCGDTLVLNLDRRTGPAWRLYQRGSVLTVHPSYWKDTGCGSHFILWNNRVLWCDWIGYENDCARSNDIEARVLAALTLRYISYEEMADLLGEIPWDVLQSCHALVRKGDAVAHPDRRTGQFRRS
jgi:hypothetical protein